MYLINKIAHLLWHYKLSIYYKFVIVIDLVYAQHVTEEH